MLKLFVLFLECVVDGDCTDGVCTDDFRCVGRKRIFENKGITYVHLECLQLKKILKPDLKADAVTRSIFFIFAVAYIGVRTFARQKNKCTLKKLV